MNLDDLRRHIDLIDEALVEQLNERIRLAQEIGKLKHQGDQDVYVPVREQAVLSRVAAHNRGPMSEASLRAIYREIMSAAIALERPIHIAHFGQPGTFTHQAARSRFGSSLAYLPCQTVPEVFSAVLKKAAEYGVVPIENSTEGPVNPTLDELTETTLKIYAEICMPVEHHLMSRSQPDAIQVIYSHPQVLGQCRQWLAEHYPQAELIPSSSTARGAELAAAQDGAGAIASRLAAELHALPVRFEAIQDRAQNATRFLVLGRRIGEPTGHDKTSVVFKIQHKVGTLFDALSAFRRNGLNMTKIESRPSRQKAWEYWFFVDFEGHALDESVQEALRELEAHCITLTVLGSYPMAELTV